MAYLSVFLSAVRRGRLARRARSAPSAAALLCTRRLQPPGARETAADTRPSFLWFFFSLCLCLPVFLNRRAGPASTARATGASAAARGGPASEREGERGLGISPVFLLQKSASFSSRSMYISFSLCARALASSPLPQRMRCVRAHCLRQHGREAAGARALQRTVGKRWKGVVLFPATFFFSFFFRFRAVSSSSRRCCSCACCPWHFGRSDGACFRAPASAVSCCRGRPSSFKETTVSLGLLFLPLHYRPFFFFFFSFLLSSLLLPLLDAAPPFHPPPLQEASFSVDGMAYECLCAAPSMAP